MKHKVNQSSEGWISEDIEDNSLDHYKSFGNPKNHESAHMKEARRP